MEAEKKKTGKFGRFLGWLISILLVGAVAAGLVALYPEMMQETGEIYEPHVNTQRKNCLEELQSLVDGMYTDWYLAQKTTEKAAGEIILGEPERQYEEHEEYKSWYIKRTAELEEWYCEEYAKELESSGIRYFIYRDSPADGYGNMNAEQIAQDAEQYPLFIEVRYDASGEPSVYQERGISDSQSVWTAGVRQRLGRNERWIEYAQGKKITHNEIKDITLFIACDAATYQSWQAETPVSSSMVWLMINAMEINYLVLVLTAVGIVIFLGLLLPVIRPLGLKEGWKAHIPVEAVLAVAVLAAWLLIEAFPAFITVSYMEMQIPGSMIYWVSIMQKIVADGREIYLILTANIAAWSAVLFSIYLCTINLRQIVAKGPVLFFKENTLAGRILSLLFQFGRKAVQFCGQIDFSNRGNRNFILAVALNFAAIVLFCCVWWVGIFLAVPYSLLLFWLLQRWWNKIRTDYVTLLSTTEEMAGGITDVEYVADAGVFHELRDALARVQGGFHTAVQEEVKSQHMKTELITNVSHDLKTPLTAIITYVDLLKNETLSAAEQQEYIEVLDKKSARLKTLIEDLFEISKATSGNIRLDKVDLNLAQLIQEVQLELEDEIMNSGIAFKVNLPEEKAMVHLDAQKTCRIFENLTMNIIKHGLTGSRAYISMELGEKQVTVMYKNVSAAEINYNAEEILERFTRGDASRNTEGSGLGLAIVKSFTEAQGGKVNVELEDDLFKVSISFPRVKTDAAGITEEK